MEKSLRARLPEGGFADVSPVRSRQMSAVRGRGNRTTEARLRFALVRAGLSGWVVQPRGLPGNPDFLFVTRKIAVFVDGCFWHGCPACGHTPKTNRPFWSAKIRKNRARDALNTQALVHIGYRVIRFWEHDLKRELPLCVAALRPRSNADNGRA